MNVLLSIKPKYVEAILNGEKEYEFRKGIFKHRDVEKVYIYSTAPVKKIVGYFVIEDIIEDHPERIWERCQDKAGIGENEFFEYFGGREKGYAIKIEKMKVMERPIDPKNIDPDFVPPQSFKYFEDPISGGPENA